MTAAQASMATPRFTRTLVESPLPGVTAPQWDALARACSVQGIRAISRSGGIGSYDMRPRRLGELGVMENLRRGPGGRWVGDLVQEYADLGVDLRLQNRVFAASMVAYDQEIASAALVLPEGVSRSGGLAILHRGGGGALRAWPEGAFAEARALCGGEEAGDE